MPPTTSSLPSFMLEIHRGKPPTHLRAQNRDRMTNAIELIFAAARPAGPEPITAMVLPVRVLGVLGVTHLPQNRDQ